MTEPRVRSLAGGIGADSDRRELAALFAAAYVRLLAARNAAQDGKNPLDSLDQRSDELVMTTPRRSRRA